MTERDANNEVILAGKRLPLRGPVPDSNLKVFQGKIVFGDYNQDSNPLLSSYVMSDFTGGNGVEDMNETLDINRYRDGTFYTRFPNQISNGYRAHGILEGSGFPTKFTGASARPRYLGDLYMTGMSPDWEAIFSVGTTLYRMTSAVSVGTLTAEPVNNAVVFQGTSANTRILIPMGASGYAVYSDVGNFANQAADATHPALQAVEVWDNKVVGIDTSGQLWWALEASTANWTSYGPTAKLPRTATARSMSRGWDRNGQATLYIVTDTDVWQFDPGGPEIFTVDVAFPPHPYHGLAAIPWGGDFYFSVGMGVHRYTSGSVTAVGLDRDQGLPAEWQGYIVGGGLVPSYNGLYALIEATNPIQQDTPGYQVWHSIQEFTGSGWHTIWYYPVDGGTGDYTPVPYSMGVSRGGGNYRLYWGVFSSADATGYLGYIELPITFANPRQLARGTGTESQDAAWMITGIFDASMKGYDKLANAVDVTIREMPDSPAFFQISYQTDDDINDTALWTQLGSNITSEGTTTVMFGTPDPDSGIYPGLTFERIRFRFDLFNSGNAPFILESVVFSFLKELPSSWSWTIEVALLNSYIESPEVINQHLEDVLEAGEMVEFILRGESHRVYMSQLSGSVETGQDEGNYRRVTLLEIPQSLGV